MSTIGLQHLKALGIFACVIDEGSFAGAARHLNTSRSRISEQITQLEEDLGVRLLQRSTRKLSLTEEGKRVYEKASSLSRLLEETREIAAQEKPSGRVSITATHDVGVTQLLPALVSFRQKHPDVELDVILSDKRLDLIAEGIDLGVRVGLPRDESLIGRALYEDRFGLFASPDYVKSHGNPDSPEALADHHWIALAVVSPMGEQRLYQDDELVIVKPAHYETCNSPMMMMKMAIAGMGIAQLFPSTIRDELASGQLVQIMPELHSQTMLFSLVYPSRKQLPKRTRALIDHLLSAHLFDR